MPTPDTDGFVVAYPQALATEFDGAAWNAGTSTGPTQCCAAATVDDTTWLASLPKAISARVPIDLKRVYIAGFSNGGMMAWKAACQRPDVFAAAEVVSGSLLVPCAKSVVHVLDAHDPTHDCIVPYHGGYTCGGKPTALLPAKFPDSANESQVVAKGSVIDFVPLTGSHTWPKLVLDVVPNPTTPTAYPEHAAAVRLDLLAAVEPSLASVLAERLRAGVREAGVAAAVDDEVLAGDEGRQVREQEDERARDLLGAAPAA